MLIACTAFTACNTHVVWASPSGANVGDYDRLATALYNDSKVSGPGDDAGSVFKFELADRELRDHPKFLMGLSTAEPKPESVANASVDMGSSEDSTAEKVKVDSDALRAMGNRKAKEMA